MEINKIINNDFVIDSDYKRHYIKPDIIKNMENNKKMTQEQKAKAYDEVRKKIALRFGSNVVEKIFSEFEMSEDERTRKRLIHLVNKSHEQGGYALHKDEAEEMLAWLEKQAQSMTITIPKDLKGTDTDGGVVGEKGEQGEQPTKEDDVRRRSTIQILEYARCLNTYNLYGKATIDKNIAWLEKQVLKPKWTKEDDNKVDDIVYFLNTAKTHYASTEAIDDCVEWLKSIKRKIEQQ